MRDLVAKMKLVPNHAMLEGKRALFCDDSIVRGTQLNDNVAELYANGAKEVHMRIACPPLIYGCRYLGFTSSKSDMELLTRRIIKELANASATLSPIPEEAPMITILFIISIFH